MPKGKGYAYPKTAPRAKPAGKGYPKEKFGDPRYPTEPFGELYDSAGKAPFSGKQKKDRS